MKLDLARLKQAGVDKKSLHIIEQLLQQDSERQREGIAVAKAKGVRFGRPPVELPPNFPIIVQEWKCKQLSLDQALRLCNMSASTFYRKAREYLKNISTEPPQNQE